MTGRPDWSTLPSDAIFTISTHILDDADHTRFRSFCTSFRSAAPHRPLLPWLLVDYRVSLCSCWVDLAGNFIPFEEVTEDNNGYAIFGGFSLCRFPNTSFFATPRLPVGTTPIAGCRSWIALLGDRSPGITLHNPFAAITIDLPALTNLERIVLSSYPTAQAPSAPCVVFVRSRIRRLIYCRPGDASWTLLPGISDGTLDDIMFYKGRLYVVDNYYRLFVCDFGAGCINVSEILPVPAFL